MDRKNNAEMASHGSKVLSQDHFSADKWQTVVGR